MALRHGALWIIIGVIVCLPGTFIITYIISVLTHHVKPLWPYISDTGALPPESCIFGQMLNLAGVFVALTTFVRYRIVRRRFVHSSSHLRRANKAGLVCGYMSAAGVSIVGNFQETNVKSIHYLGATLAFGCGVVYICINGALSYWLIPAVNNVVVFCIRLICCGTSIAAFACTVAASQVFSGHAHHYGQVSLLSTVAEWAMVLVLLIFFITYIPEFKRVQLLSLVVKHLDLEESDAYPV